MRPTLPAPPVAETIVPETEERPRPVSELPLGEVIGGVLFGPLRPEGLATAWRGRAVQRGLE